MIRIAVLGEEADACIKLAPRVQGASFTKIGQTNQLADDRIDGVVICSNAAPERDCRQAVTHGKHVLLTPPPESPANASELLQTCQTAGVLLMAGFSDRFLPSTQTIKQALEAGQLGDPGLLRLHRWNLGADAVIDIDLAIWLFQAMPTEVYAVTREAGAYFQVHLGFPAGGMAVIDSHQAASADAYFSMSLIGSSGAAYADDHHNEQLLFRRESTQALKTGDSRIARGGEVARLAQLQEFANAIHEQREPAVTGEDARRAALVSEAAWQTIEHRRAARLSGEHYEF